MSTPIYDPKTIDLSLKSSEKTETTVYLTKIPVSANVTATIIEDTSPNKCFKVKALKKSELRNQVIECDPDLPPPILKRCKEGRAEGHLWRRDEYVITDATNGSIPLNVNDAALVEVDISFEAPDPPQGGIFTATLLIQGDTWDPIKIPLSLFEAKVDTLLRTNEMTYHDPIYFEHGRSVAQIPIITKLIAGPETEVVYDPNDMWLLGEEGNHGIYLVENIVSISQSNPEVKSYLYITLDEDADIGDYVLVIPYKSKTFGGRALGEIRLNFNIVKGRSYQFSQWKAKVPSLAGIIEIKKAVLFISFGSYIFHAELYSKDGSYCNLSIIIGDNNGKVLSDTVEGYINTPTKIFSLMKDLPDDFEEVNTVKFVLIANGQKYVIDAEESIYSVKGF